MKIEWISPVLNDQFLRIMIKEFGGYEDNIRHVLIKNIFTFSIIVTKQEAKESTSNGTINKIDLIIPISQFGREKECVEIKMYNFVRSVPKEINNDIGKLANLGNNILRTFLYFGYYGKFQNPQNSIVFDVNKRIKEINKHCKMLQAIIPNSLRLVNRRRIHITCPCTGFIYYAFWLSF